MYRDLSAYQKSKNNERNRIAKQTPGDFGGRSPRKKLPEGGVYGRRLLPCYMQDWP